MGEKEWHEAVDLCLDEIQYIESRMGEGVEMQHDLLSDYNRLWDWFDDLVNAVPYEVRCPEPPCWGDIDYMV